MTADEKAKSEAINPEYAGMNRLSTKECFRKTSLAPYFGDERSLTYCSSSENV